MSFTPDEERSLTGALFAEKPKGYGAAVTANSVSYGTNSKVKPRKIMKHVVNKGETLQSLAIKYDTNVADIKKLNRLWNNESLSLRKEIEIPVYKDVDTDLLHDTDKLVLPTEPTKQTSPSPTHNGGHNCLDKSNSDNLDFFAKYDASINSIKKNVAKQVEKASEYLEEEDILFSSSSQNTTSRTSSLQNEETGIDNRLVDLVDIKVTPEPVVRSKVKKKLDKLERRQDELFEL